MEKETDKAKEKNRLSASFITGAIALTFLITGYQTAVFVHHAAITKIQADRDTPDTVFIAIPQGENHGTEDSPGDGGIHYNPVRKQSYHSPRVENIRGKTMKRAHESFRFNPNTVSVEDLQRLGFSLRQAQSIDNYRKKGGLFRRKQDFARSYVVEDSVYRRLEPFIDIPLLDLNKADSAAFETLPGIGKYFAARMVSYRKELGGYSYKEQLLDIRYFDREKFDGLADLITIDSAGVAPFRLWTLTEDSLRLHPYINTRAAHGIVLYRENNPPSVWNISGLASAGVLTADEAEKLKRCRIAMP